MFVVNDDNSIYVTRGDIVFFTVTAEDQGNNYKFQPGDVVRIKVFGKKDAKNVVLQKDFPVMKVTEEVEIFLSEEDTKIGEVISKPTDYWYEVELNPEDNPQTIIGYDEDGAKVFRLLPEGRDVSENDPVIQPEDIPIMDKELDMTSLRPVQNQAIARAVTRLEAEVKNNQTANSDLAKLMTDSNNGIKEEVAVERARIDNLLSGSAADDAEVVDIRVDVHGDTHGSAGTAVREQVKGVYDTVDNLFEPGDSLIPLRDTDLSYGDYTLVIKNGYVTVNGTLSASVRIKLTNKIAKGITNVPESWLTETAPFVVGQTYIAKAHHISGTVKGDDGADKSSGVVVSARDAENNVLFSDTKGAQTLAVTASHAQLFLPFGVYDNAVFLPVIEEGETLTAPEDIKTRYLSDRVGIKESHFANFDFAKMLKALTYTTVEEFSHIVLHEDNLDHYADNQGMCTDGENLYYSLRREVGDSGNTILKKYNLATGKVTLTVENHSYGHANGMAYIPHENALYVVKLDTAGTIFKVDADTLEYISEFSLKDVLSPKVEWYMGVGAVAYDATREKIVFLLRGEEESDGRTRKGFAVFDKEMRFEKIIKTQYIPCFSYSGLATDENFIYLTITNPHNDDGEWLIAYDWHGNEVYRTEISYFNHLEAQAVIGDTFYFSYNQPYNGAHIVECKPLVTGSVYKTDVMVQYNLND